LRKNDAAMRVGNYIALNTSDANVYSYLRQYKDTANIVVLNMSATKQTATFDLSKQGLSGSHAVTLLQIGAEVPNGAFASVTLAP
ncbi:alpha-glucosidase C-terminal domain-containing protein, partial [Klebsiella pneumoniae]|nr:alpha-glucosidase C-terminal domain-containing protein [Klebsiella pneumoniae]